MSIYRIVLADDHVMLRQGLRKIIDEMTGLTVVGEAGDGLELIDLVRETAPDLAILDISMPRLRGIEAIHEIRSIAPNVKILILTMHKNREYLHHAIAAGADGYLLKEDADRELFAAIATIRAGRRYVSPLLADQLPEEWPTVGRGSLTLADGGLSNRERQVLKLIAEGKSSKEIAELLRLSIRTVEHHRARVMKKLSKRNVAELVQYAFQKGFV